MKKYVLYALVGALSFNISAADFSGQENNVEESDFENIKKSSRVEEIIKEANMCFKVSAALEKEGAFELAYNFDKRMMLLLMGSVFLNTAFSSLTSKEHDELFDVFMSFLEKLEKQDRYKGDKGKAEHQEFMNYLEKIVNFIK